MDWMDIGAGVAGLALGYWGLKHYLATKRIL